MHSSTDQKKAIAPIRSIPAKVSSPTLPKYFCGKVVLFNIDIHTDIIGWVSHQVNSHKTAVALIIQKTWVCG